MPNIVEITDFSAPELDIFARKTENQLLNREHPDEGIFIAESPKVVERALDGGYEPVSVLVETRHIDGEAREILARMGDVPIYTAPFEVLTQLTGFQLTRGVLCAMRRKSLPSLAQALSGATRIAVLENVMNPTNVGAIFRSAAALGMDAVLLTPGSSNPLYRRAIRVSMGTVFQVTWTFAPENWQQELKTMGFATAALALREDTLSIRDPRLAKEEKLALVLGTEGDGLADGTITNCDYTVKIPMTHGVDSLNVAAASAVAFFQLGNN
jgi:tRNA G18 (ribose-2'-O)-methylase SpoU